MGVGIPLKELVLLFSPNKCILIRVYSKKGLEALVNAKPLDIIQNDDIKDTQAINILYNKGESHFIIEVVKN